jgi:ABC-2 type transport system permease protein
MSIAYVRLESFRQLKNVRTLVFSLAVPIVMLFAFGGVYGGSGQVDAVTHLPWIVVTTIQMAAYGGMIAALSQSFNIVTERSLGWNRQLRITPLSGTGYMISKIVTAMLVGLIAIAVVIAIAILSFHPQLGAMNWIGAGVGIWLGILPFALLSIVIGQFAKPEYAQPLFTAVFLIFSLLGGLWVPLQILPSWVSNVGQIVPSYWLNRLGQMGAHLSGDVLTPALVLAGWTIVLAAFIVWRYRRDSARS